MGSLFAPSGSRWRHHRRRQLLLFRSFAARRELGLGNLDPVHGRSVTESSRDRGVVIATLYSQHPVRRGSQLYICHLPRRRRRHRTVLLRTLKVRNPELAVAELECDIIVLGES